MEIDGKTLDTIKIDECAVIKEIRCENPAKRRFLDLGLIGGTTVRALYKSPYNDPVAFLVRGTVIALRSEDCRQIVIY